MVRWSGGHDPLEGDTVPYLPFGRRPWVPEAHVHPNLSLVPSRRCSTAEVRHRGKARQRDDDRIQSTSFRHASMD